MNARLLLTAFVAAVTPLVAGCGNAAPKWTSEQVLESFQAAGLEAENPRPMTREDYGAAPMMAVEGTRFFIPSLGADAGGRILIFDSEEGLRATQEFYEEMGRQSAVFFSWVFVRDNVLVQINGDLPEEQARRYEAALTGLE